MSRTLALGNSLAHSNPNAMNQSHLKEAVVPPSPPRFKFILLTLDRPSPSVSWGLSLSLFEKSYLIVGESKALHIASLVQNLWSVESTLNPWFFWQNRVDIGTVPRYLTSLPSHPTPRTVLPGDCILSINGIVVPSFGTLSNATNALRSKNHVQLVLLRYPAALELARMKRDEAVAAAAGSVMPIPDGSIRAAQAAFFVYRNIPVPRSFVSSTATTARTAQLSVPDKRHFASSNSHDKASKPSNTSHFKPHKKTNSWKPPPPILNPLFRDAHGKPLVYEDSAFSFECDPDEGHRAALFLQPVADFHQWLQIRKAAWRKRYRLPSVEETIVDEVRNADRFPDRVAIDFWTPQGFDNFPTWLRTRTTMWKTAYSWNQKKLERLEKDVEEIVSLDRDDFGEWLRVRKNQWKVQRRKRQRELTIALPSASKMTAASLCSPLHNTVVTPEGSPASSTVTTKRSLFTLDHPELVLIDAFLEEQERSRRILDSRPPLDLSFIFDAALGCPDDVVVHIFQYLNPVEHSKLLCISKKTRQALQQRGDVFRQLCPAHWKLPRRPRKPWHELYLTQLHTETERSRKAWDDLLSRASAILLKGDQLQSIEKLIGMAERDFRFDVNYSSGVVCERNSILNLAVIHQRHKVVRWLVETKKADIETCDRGNFTPLLNAAWAGDRFLVRFFLQKGASRSQLGTGHYTRPLALPDFVGFTAEGWANERGYEEIAKLLRLGL